MKHNNKFYRISNLKTPAMKGAIAAELIFYDSEGQDRTLNGVALASSSINDHRGNPEYLFDKNNSTTWLNDWKNNSLLTTWVGYESPEGYHLKEVSVLMRQDSRISGDDWLTADIEYSITGTDWFFYGKVEFNVTDNQNYFKVPVLEIEPPNNDFETKHLYWRISDIRSESPFKFLGYFNFLADSGEISDNPSYVITSSNISDNFPLSNVLNLENNFYIGNSEEDLSWSIGYKFKTKVKLEDIYIKMASVNDLETTWKSFSVEGSDDGVTWDFKYFIDTTFIFKNDTSLHKYSVNSLDEIVKYIPNFENELKFFRVSNFNMNTQSFKNNTPKIEILNLDFKTDNTISEYSYNLNNTFSNFGIHPENAFDLSIDSFSESFTHPIKIQEYFLGYMFEKEKEVNFIDINLKDSLEFYSFDVESSTDGFNWEFYGFCETSENLYENKGIYSVNKFSKTPKSKFWKISNFVSVSNNVLNYNTNSSIISGVSFKTIFGLKSNNPKFENPSHSLFFPETPLPPINSFETAKNVSLNSRIKSEIKINGQKDYYKFELKDPTDIKIYSSGDTDMYGSLYSENKDLLFSDDDSGDSRNFLISQNLPPGIYYILARQYSTGTGKYTLNIQKGSELLETSDFSIFYEFSSPQYVNSVYISSLSPILYCSLYSSSDNENWFFKGYLNFSHFYKFSDLFQYSSFIFEENFLQKLSFKDFLKGSKNLSFKSKNEFTFEPLCLNNISINIYNKDNDGTISGEVTELDIPVIREVGLYDRATRQLIAITWSDEKGQYKFTGIDSTRKYYVHAIDSNDFYNAVTQDMIEPLI